MNKIYQYSVCQRKQIVMPAFMLIYLSMLFFCNCHQVLCKFRAPLSKVFVLRNGGLTQAKLFIVAQDVCRSSYLQSRIFSPWPFLKIHCEIGIFCSFTFQSHTTRLHRDESSTSPSVPNFHIIQFTDNVLTITFRYKTSPKTRVSTKG
jgi:hypothetical protein